MNATKSQPGPQNIKIGVRPETKAKYDRIAEQNRWTLVETADALADCFLAKRTKRNRAGGAGAVPAAAGSP